MPEPVVGSASKIEGGRIVPGKGWVSQEDYDRIQKGETTAVAKGGTEDPSSPHYKPPAPTSAGMEAAGEEDIAGQTAADLANQQRAEGLALGMRAGQAGAMGKFDTADTNAQVGLQDVQTQIQTTREQVEKIPDVVKGEIDRQQSRLSYGMNAARTGLGVQRNEALTSVVQGQGQAMDAAVASIHGATRQQMSDIDAQVQQGTLSPSQAQMMKSQIRMGSSMQLSAAVGQTIHMFKETEAEVAKSFGQSFAQMEGQFAGVQGQFGAQAVGAFGAAQSISAEINAQLDATSAGAIAHRDVILSQNATSRAAAQSMNDQNNMAMLDYTADQWVMRTPVAANNYQVQRDVFSLWMQSDQGQQAIDAMKESGKTADLMNILGIGGAIIEGFTGG